MWPLPVGDLFGVGPSAAKRLNTCGMYTIGDLAAMDRDTAVRLLGTRGDTLWNYANGREADPADQAAHQGQQLRQQRDDAERSGEARTRRRHDAGTL